MLAEPADSLAAGVSSVRAHYWYGTLYPWPNAVAKTISQWVSH